MMRIWLKTNTRRSILTVAVAALIAISLPSAAQAINAFHAVNFYENDSPSDTVTTYQTENAPTDLTLFNALSPSFTHAGFLFNDWNTSADGSGTSYADGVQYSFGSDLNLYAQWTQSFHATTFNENDGPSDTVYTSETRNTTSNLTLFSSLNPAFTKTGFTFNDWSTYANGGGTTYADGASYNFLSDLTLYAQWTQNPAPPAPVSSPPSSQVSVSFNDGGATGVTNPVSVNSGATVQLPATGTLSYPGFTLMGWYTAPTGGTLVGLSGAPFVPATSLTVYAQWVASTPITLSFANNGGTGSIAPMSVTSGASATLPTGVGLLYIGHTFSGWSATPSSPSTIYAGGAKFVVSAPVTLYAVWIATLKVPATAELAGAIGPFPVGSSVLGSSMKRQIHNIGEGMKARHFTTASMFGYSLASETGASLNTLSTRRATAVENYLRDVLVALHVQPVAMHAVGESSVRSSSDTAFRRVEIFLKL
jgi:hypothetical protein